jgi:hypothetical protein
MIVIGYLPFFCTQLLMVLFQPFSLSSSLTLHSLYFSIGSSSNTLKWYRYGFIIRFNLNCNNLVITLEIATWISADGTRISIQV